MSRNNSEHIWIEAGYNQFAADGLDGIQVERLAKIIGLNKSGYYHYFGDQETYLELVMKKHVGLANPFVEDFTHVQQFDPQFMEVLLKYKTPVMAHNQLVRNRHHDLLFKTYQYVNTLVDPIVIRLFADFIGFKDHMEFSAKYYSQVRDMFYTQITGDKMNYPFLRDFFYNAKDVIRQAVGISYKPDA